MKCNCTQGIVCGYCKGTLPQPTSQWSVLGNWDQIEKVPALRMLAWIPKPGWPTPNRVVLQCEDIAQARYVYATLEQAGKVAFRNWLD